MSSIALPFAIQHGVPFLDQCEPDWWRTGRKCSIDVDTLDMGSMFDCIFGQLYGHYKTGLELHELDDWGAANLGLHAFEDSAEEDAALTRDWRHVIIARRVEAMPQLQTAA